MQSLVKSMGIILMMLFILCGGYGRNVMAESITGEIAEGASYYAAFQVRKEYFDENNAAKNVTGNFYFKVYDAKTNKALSNTAYAIALNNASNGTSKRIRMKMASDDAERQLKIVETDSKGNALASGETYDITYDNQTFTLTPSQDKEVVATIRNTEVVKKAELGEPATLTLTKRVTYKGQPIRVNEEYYIGIFDDAGLSKLRYKKAMRFTNASEVSSPMTIHVEKLKDTTVTFYIAEVDVLGHVIEGGKATGYTISQNKKEVTLNADNLKDEIMITNDVIPNSRVEAMLVAPDSQFAGDAATLALVQSLAHQGETEKTIEIEKNNDLTGRAQTQNPTIKLPKVKVTFSESLAGKSATIKWKKQKNISGYQIQYALKNNFAKSKTKTIGKKTSYKIKKLKKGKRYYIRIRAYKTVDGVKYYSEWSKVKKVKIKK